MAPQKVGEGGEENFEALVNRSAFGIMVILKKCIFRISNIDLNE